MKDEINFLFNFISLKFTKSLHCLCYKFDLPKSKPTHFTKIFYYFKTQTLESRNGQSSNIIIALSKLLHCICSRASNFQHSPHHSPHATPPHCHHYHKHGHRHHHHSLAHAPIHLVMPLVHPPYHHNHHHHALTSAHLPVGKSPVHHHLHSL